MREVIIVVLIIVAAKGIVMGVRSIEESERRRWAEHCDKIDAEQAASLAGL